MQPHLALMKKTARRHTNQANAGAGLLLLWLADDIERRVNVPLTELGLSESKLGVLMFFGLVERGSSTARWSRRRTWPSISASRAPP